MLRGFADRLLALLFVADAALTCSALLLADWLRHTLPFGERVPPGTFLRPSVLIAAFLIWPFFLRFFGAYDSRRTRTFLDEVRAVVPAGGAATLVVLGLFFPLLF